MKLLWIDKNFTYDGSQLKSQYAYFNHGLLGDSIIAWQGQCKVANEFMVDGEDLLQGEKIEGSHMLHFIVEKFHSPLNFAVALQRLMTARMLELLKEMSPETSAKNLKREGDDIFLENKKLSISIATISPLSIMIHFAINITNNGTPVPTLSLQDLNIRPESLAKAFMQWLVSEDQSITDATQKVRWVR